MGLNDATSGKAANAGIGVLMRSDRFQHLVPGVHTLGGQGNTLAIETGLGVVLVDAGPGGPVTRAMIGHLRTLTDQRVYAIVYSHGHAGYNAGVPLWMEHARERGEAPPLLIGHCRVAPRYRRYIETAGLQSWLNSRQFRRTFRPLTAQDWHPPQIEFEDTLTLDCAGRSIQLIAAPSETDDTVAVWLPAERFLYASAAMIRSIPNVGTPLRTLRDPMRWAATLERLHALRPLMVLPEFGRLITDAREIEDAFRVPVRALHYLREQVVERMNRGMSEREILADMDYPDELFGHPFMRAIYGSPDYIVRDIWRSENGWWDRNATSLHPCRPAEAAAAVFDAIGDPRAVLERARELAAQRQTQLAMHVVDLVAVPGSEHAIAREALAFKAFLCDARSVQFSSVVSRQILRSCAEDLRGLPIGSTRDLDPPSDFSWD